MKKEEIIRNLQKEKYKILTLHEEGKISTSECNRILKELYDKQKNLKN